MKTACTNHPRINAVAKGLCQACYMRSRRAQQSGRMGRQRNGANYQFAMRHTDYWLDRYRDKISGENPDGCHEWMAGKTKGGYGVMHLANKTLLAHRLAFTLAGGDPSVSVVMHTCDNPACVNPKHLRGGSYKQNTADMDAKGRRNIGKAGNHLKNRELHPRAKAVSTPAGEFASAALAAEVIGLTAVTLARYCRSGHNGYRYL